MGWAASTKRHSRRSPRFSLDLWNCFDTVREGLPKTNNSVEGWLRGFHSQISAEHPNIWKFILAIKKEQSLKELQIEQYISGRKAPQQKKNKLSADTLARVVATFSDESNIKEYLRGVAHNFNY